MTTRILFTIATPLVLLQREDFITITEVIHSAPMLYQDRKPKTKLKIRFSYSLDPSTSPPPSGQKHAYPICAIPAGRELLPE